MNKLLTRDDFRESVFRRDQYRCVICGKPASEEKLDAHHIIERRLFTASHEKGGYFLDNGATVCEEHHRQCEMTLISCDDLRERIGIVKPILPDNFYPDMVYDKWGNIIQQNGTRLKGPLFYDGSVQTILEQGGVLNDFVNRFKYPRTPHLPWSEGMHDDDRRIETLDHFIGREVVATIKYDGENSTIYRDYFHARSLDGNSHPSQAWLKNFAAKWQHYLTDDQRICGENCFAKHSIHYDEDNPLPSYFMGFSMWEQDRCLSWDDTMDNFSILGIEPITVLYRGIWDEKIIRNLYSKDDWDRCEGYVVRVTDSFTMNEFKHCMAKFVRKGHVQTVAHHWKAQKVIPNSVSI